MSKHSGKKRAKRSPIWFIPKDKLQQLLDKSSSYGEVLQSIGFGHHSIRILKTRIIEDELSCLLLDTNRLRKTASRAIGNAQPLEEVLVINSNYSRKALKNRLIKEGKLKNQCYICGQLPEWNGKALTLQIDHINGINTDNRLENLRILCPHCHSQTDTYAGRNNIDKYNSDENGLVEGNPDEIKRKKKREDAEIKKQLLKHCPICDGFMKNGLETCSYECSSILRRKVKRPSKEELSKLLLEKPTTHIAKQFGVSDKAITKWVKSYGLSKPPRGYWAKIAAKKTK